LNVQLFVAADQIAFLELNPRFGGGFPLTWAAGARLPELVLDGGSRSDARPGLVMLRYDDAVFVELAELPEGHLP
jgi:carbamoyl-phosphate synthase large subunit